MAGEKRNNTTVERVTLMGGTADVEFDAEAGKAYLGLMAENATPYVQVEFGGVPWVDDLIGALQRMKKQLKKSEQ